MKKIESDDVGSNEMLFEALAKLADIKKGKLRRNSGKRRSTDKNNKEIGDEG